MTIKKKIYTTLSVVWIKSIRFHFYSKWQIWFGIADTETVVRVFSIDRSGKLCFTTFTKLPQLCASSRYLILYVTWTCNGFDVDFAVIFNKIFRTIFGHCRERYEFKYAFRKISDLCCVPKKRYICTRFTPTITV